MAMRKRILLSAAALYLLSSAAAYAQLNVELNLGQPAYVEAAPVYAPVYMAPYPTYYDPRHRDHDYGYWREHRRGYGHSDNGRHEGWDRDRRDHGEQEHGDHERR